MISDAALLEAVEQGVTVAQLVAMILADRKAAREKRAMRKAGRLGDSVTQGGLVESGSRFEADSIAGSAPINAPVSRPRPASAEGLAQPRVKLAVARKAVPICGINGNAQEVLAALLDFCNPETLRCSPGVGTIAEKLGRVGKYRDRHVRRGIERLVEAGLLRVAINAGMGHANAYFPQWDRLAAIVAAFESGQGVAAGVRPADAKGDSLSGLVRQTQKKIPTSLDVRRVQQARGGRFVDDHAQRRLPLMSPIAGGRDGVPHPAAVAAEEARRRLAVALAMHLQPLGASFGKAAMAEIPAEAWEAAKTAEMNRRGSGLAVLLHALGPGPPQAMPEVSETLRKRLG